MIGSGLDEHKTVLVSWIVRAGLGSRFTLLGVRGDIPQCMAAMDVFVLPSLTEGFPNVVGEAMAVGVPCAVTDVGDSALLVGDTGEITPPKNAAALAAAICRLLAMPASDRRSLGGRARLRIDSEFSMERVCERFAAIYERVSNPRVT
jgi:glycosyltransferase involved in cell wall biosynthesis